MASGGRNHDPAPERNEHTRVPGTPALRFDLIAGLTAAAVVLPKAMAYATVAGLPVAVGLYTALIPMAIYALLGTSRVLSVSSTTTLAILAGTQLGLAVPDGDPSKLITATATLSALVGVMLLLARLMRLGFVANFISTPVLTGFKAGIGLVIVLDQVPKLFGLHIDKQGFFRDVVSVTHHLPETSLITLAVAAATFAVLIGMERMKPHSPAPLVAVGGAIAASWYFGLKALGVSTVGLIPQGFPALTLPDLGMVAALAPGALGLALMSFTETIAAGRAFARPTDPPDQPEPRAGGHGRRQYRGRTARRNASRWRHFADRGGTHGGRSVAEGIAGNRSGCTGHHAVSRAGAWPVAERHAGRARHRLLGRPDPAGGVPRDPQRALDGIPLGADRVRRRAGVRHSEGHRGGDHRVDDRPGEPDRASAGVRHRPQDAAPTCCDRCPPSTRTTRRSRAC